MKTPPAAASGGVSDEATPPGGVGRSSWLCGPATLFSDPPPIPSVRPCTTSWRLAAVPGGLTVGGLSRKVK